MGRGRIFWPVVNSLLFPSPHRSAKGKREKKWSKDKCVPEKQLFWTISKRKGLSFPGSRYFARDGAISRQLLRPPARLCRVITIMAWNFYFPLFGCGICRGRNTRSLTYIYLYIYKFFLCVFTNWRAFVSNGISFFILFLFWEWRRKALGHFIFDVLWWVKINAPLQTWSISFF